MKFKLVAYCPANIYYLGDLSYPTQIYVGIWSMVMSETMQF